MPKTTECTLYLCRPVPVVYGLPGQPCRHYYVLNEKYVKGETVIGEAPEVWGEKAYNEETEGPAAEEAEAKAEEEAAEGEEE